jgi:hypothetical protein
VNGAVTAINPIIEEHRIGTSFGNTRFAGDFYPASREIKQERCSQLK